MISDAHVTITCLTAAGVGRHLTVRVTRANLQSSDTGIKLNYGEPVITAVTGLPAGGLRTAGGDAFYVLGENLGDAADAVAYVVEFLAKLADVADAAVAAAADARDPALGALLVLGCGHNAPWRRGERDAYLAWLGKEL